MVSPDKWSYDRIISLFINTKYKLGWLVQTGTSKKALVGILQFSIPFYVKIN